VVEEFLLDDIRAPEVQILFENLAKSRKMTIFATSMLNY
jgi:hypothetical protein